MPELTIEMVPKPLWGISLASLMPRSKWDTLRRRIYQEYNYHCSVCGASNTTMICHEVWEYNDTTHVQTLTGFIALCRMCNYVKHLGLTDVLASGGNVDMKQVIQHYCQVNHCDGTQFLMDKADADAEWRERSQHQWTSSLGTFSELLPDFQARIEAKRGKQLTMQPPLDL